MQTLYFYGIAIAAVCCYAFLSVIAKKMQITIPPFAFIAITMTILTLMAWGVSFVFERDFSIRSLSVLQLFLLVLFSVVNLFGFALYLKALTGMPVGHYQLVGILVPVVGSAFAFLLLGEQLGTRFFLAIPVIFAGLYIALMK